MSTRIKMFQRLWLVIFSCGFSIHETQGTQPQFDNAGVTVSNVDADTIGLNGDVIYKLAATDADGDSPWFFLYDHLDQFSMNAVTGELTAIRNLHYLVSQTIQLDVGVYDANDRNNANVQHDTLTLEIKNGNNVPYISGWPITAFVPESAVKNTEFCSIDVIDLDNDPLFYDLNVDPSSESGLFYIDTACKCIRLSGAYSLNYERKQQYNVVVKVRDTWSTSAAYTCTVSITNANDIPYFTKSLYTVNIDEETSPTVDPEFVAVDEDGDTYAYSFMNANHSNWFHINDVTGLITVTNPVDRETLGSTQIYLTVYAVDVNGGTGSTQVLFNIADVNDNAPVFTSGTYTFTTNQLASPGTSIGTVSASDIDLGANSKISYDTPSSTSYFNVLSNGAITTAKTLEGLAYGSVTQIIVYAIDGGTLAKTGSATVDISFEEAITTTIPTTTTTEEGYFDVQANVIVFAILMSLLGLVLLVGLYFCMRKLITGHWCSPSPDDEDFYDRRRRRSREYGDFRYELTPPDTGGRSYPIQKERF